MRVGAELQTTVLLRDDHREEALVLEVLPHFGRQVAAPMSDVEFIEHLAELFAGTVEERLLFRCELRCRVIRQQFPVRVAAEELAVPPHGTGLKRLAFSVRHSGQQLSVGTHEGATDQRDAQRWNVEQPQQSEQGPKEPLPEIGRQPGRAGHPGIGQQQSAGRQRIENEWEPTVREVQNGQ